MAMCCFGRWCGGDMVEMTWQENHVASSNWFWKFWRGSFLSFGIHARNWFDRVFLLFFSIFSKWLTNCIVFPNGSSRRRNHCGPYIWGCIVYPGICPYGVVANKYAVLSLEPDWESWSSFWCGCVSVWGVIWLFRSLSVERVNMLKLKFRFRYEWSKEVKSPLSQGFVYSRKGILAFGDLPMQITLPSTEESNARYNEHVN